MKEVPGFENYYADEDKKLSTSVSNRYFCIKGDPIKMQLMKILEGEVHDPHTSIYWYWLDEDHDDSGDEGED